MVQRSPQDEKLAALVLREGLLTPQQLDECVRIQARLREPRTLAQIIVARRYLSPEDLRAAAAREVARRSTTAVEPLDPAREDELLARELVDRRMLDVTQARECVALTRKIRLTRPDVKLIQVVLKKGFADKDTLRQVFLELERRRAQRAKTTTPSGMGASESALGQADSFAGEVARAANALARGGAPSPLLTESTGFDPHGSSGSGMGFALPRGSSRLGAAPMFAEPPARAPSPPPRAPAPPPVRPAMGLGIGLDDRAGYRTVELDPEDPALHPSARYAAEKRQGVDADASTVLGALAEKTPSSRNDPGSFWSGMGAPATASPAPSHAFPPDSSRLAPTPFAERGDEASPFTEPTLDAPFDPGGGGGFDTGAALETPPFELGSRPGGGLIEGPSSIFGRDAQRRPQDLGSPQPVVSFPLHGSDSDPVAPASKKDWSDDENVRAKPPARAARGAGETQRDRASAQAVDLDDEDEDEDEDDRRPPRPEPKKGAGKLPVIAGAVIVVGLIVGLVFKRIHDARVLEEQVSAFTTAANAKPRDVRKATKLGRDLPEDAKKRPEIAQTLARLEMDLKAFEARQAALAELNKTLAQKTATPDDRIEAAKRALAIDEHCVQAYLERARATMDLARRVGTPPADAARERPDARRRRREEAWRKRRELESRAKDDLNRAIAEDDKVVDSYWTRARVLEATVGERDGARVSWEKVRELDPDSPLGLIAQGRLKELDRDGKGAIGLYDKAVEKASDSVDALVFRGRGKLAVGDKKGAFDDADSALGRAPASTEALELRAKARFELSQDAKGALEDLEKEIEHDPYAATAYALRANIRYAGNDRAGASDDAEHALDLDETATLAHLTRALILMDDKRNSEALSALNFALLYDDKLIPALLARGRLKLEEEDLDHAFHDFRHVLDLDPLNARALANHARILIERKEIDQARKELDQAIEIDRKMPEAWMSRGQLAQEPPPNHDEAIRSFTKAIELRSNYPMAYFLRGVSYHDRNRLDEAISDLQQALKLKLPGKTHEIYYVLGHSYQAKKAWAEAAECYKQTLQLSPVGWQTLDKVRSNLRLCEAEAKKAAEKPEEPKPEPPKSDAKEPKKDGSK